MKLSNRGKDDRRAGLQAGNSMRNVGRGHEAESAGVDLIQTTAQSAESASTAN